MFFCSEFRYREYIFAPGYATADVFGNEVWQALSGIDYPEDYSVLRESGDADASVGVVLYVYPLFPPVEDEVVETAVSADAADDEPSVDVHPFDEGLVAVEFVKMPFDVLPDLVGNSPGTEIEMVYGIHPAAAYQVGVVAYRLVVDGSKC